MLLQQLARDFRAEDRMPGQGGHVLNGRDIVQPRRQFNDLQVGRDRFAQFPGILDHHGQMLIDKRRAKAIPVAPALIEHVLFYCFWACALPSTLA